MKRLVPTLLLILLTLPFPGCMAPEAGDTWEPSPAGQQLAKVVVYLRRGDFQSARNAFEAAEAADPNHGALAVVRSRLDSEAAARERLSALQEAFNSGDLDEATTLFDALIPGGDAHSRALDLHYDKKIKEYRELRKLLQPELGTRATQAFFAARLRSNIISVPVDTRGKLDTLITIIPPGEFIGGSCDEKVPCLRKVGYHGRKDSLRQPTDAPQHAYDLPGHFAIAIAETPVWQVQACLDAGACSPDHITFHDPETAPLCNIGKEGGEKLPANCIDLEGATSHCTWVDGWVPNEVQWERAARGADARRYPWGHRPPSCDQSNHLGTEVPCTVPAATHEVYGSYAGINARGLFNTSGNVAEWALSPYIEGKPYQSARDWPEGALPVVRGGGFLSPPEDVRTASRKPTSRDTRSPDIGFRCAFKR